MLAPNWLSAGRPRFAVEKYLLDCGLPGLVTTGLLGESNKSTSSSRTAVRLYFIVNKFCQEFNSLLEHCYVGASYAHSQTGYLALPNWWKSTEILPLMFVVILQRALMLMWNNRLANSKVCQLASTCGRRCCSGLCSLHRPAAYLLSNFVCK